MPAHPVIISVPHAGRYYPPAMFDNARVPGEVLQRLEDRYVDLLAKRLSARGVCVIAATYARAWIDCNRAEDEWDDALISGGEPSPHSGRYARAGLGIIPHRLSGAGELWRSKTPYAELLTRIETVHRPYHAAIAGALNAAAQRHGGAVLIDLHSMPRQNGGEPQLVLGDRYGLTASAQLVDRLTAVAEGHGVVAARNTPYAGAHTIQRHAARRARVEAVQVEIDRTLYLDARMEPSPDGIARMIGLVEALAAAAHHHAQGVLPWPQAAE